VGAPLMPRTIDPPQPLLPAVQARSATPWTCTVRILADREVIKQRTMAQRRLPITQLGVPNKELEARDS